MDFGGDKEGRVGFVIGSIGFGLFYYPNNRFMVLYYLLY